MKTLRWIYSLGLLALLLFSVSAVTARPAGTVLYVDRDAAGPLHDGLSWTTAYTTVQNALDWTNTHTATTYEIWVAEGVYYPDEGGLHVDNAVTETFLIAWNNVQLYGGFAATETARSQRDWAVHPTVLSGDIDHNDLNADGNFINEVYSDTVGSNAYHVMYLDGATNEPLTAETVIDGFTITGGKADSSSNESGWDIITGGGLYCNGSGGGHGCNPVISRVIFNGNYASYWGGGMYNDGSFGGDASGLLAEVVFQGNGSDWWGGGLGNNPSGGGTSSPILISVVFEGNYSHAGGGGMANVGYPGGNSNPILHYVVFKRNHAPFSYGGGMYNFGFKEGHCRPILIDVIFEGNDANVGGGMFSDGTQKGTSNSWLVNVVFKDNEATAAGGMGTWGHLSGSSNSVLMDVVFENNHVTEEGGGLLIYEAGGMSKAFLTNVIFRGNEAGLDGGGAYVWSSTDVDDSRWMNVVFSGNRAGRNGGGICLDDVTPAFVGNPRFINVTFAGNQAGGDGGALYHRIARPVLVNSILWGNRANGGAQIYNMTDEYTPVVLFSDIEGGYTGTAVLNVDPQFVQPISATFAPTTTGDYHLRRGSPLINAGNNLSVTTATDLDGRPRVIDGRVDMGAYEYSPYMTVVKTGNGDGTVTSQLAGILCGLACAYTFPPNAVVTLTAAPMLSSTFDGWVGMPAGTQAITLLMKEGAHATAIFNLKVFTITAGSNAGGQILPGGAQTATYGSRRVFAIRPATGYALVDVGVDGVSVGRVDLYAFNNVTAGHTISATFVPVSFTVTVTPASLPADGLSMATVTVRATEPGGRVSFAGREVELSWARGSDVSPVKVTLDEDGAASWLYTAGALAGMEVITATLPDVGITHVATAGLELTAAPLQGRLTYERAADLVTYTFVLSNAGMGITQTHVVMTGSVPLHTELVTASTNLTFTAGGDYGVGYVALPEIAALGPGESAELRWTVRRLDPVADLVTQGHGQSDGAALRVIARWQAWKVLLPGVFKR